MLKGVSYLLKLAALFIVYLLTARFGLSLFPVSGFATLVWPPTGVSLVALFLFGYKFAPAIALGALFANLLSGASLWGALGIALGNTLEAIIGTNILKQVSFRPPLERTTDVLGLILVGLLSTAISATIGTTSLIMAGQVSAVSFNPTWAAWWIGDMLSVFTVAPFLFVWSSKLYSKVSKIKIIEVVITFSAFILLLILIFNDDAGIAVKNSPITYLTYPILVWSGLRLGQRFTTTLVFIMAAFAIWGTIRGQGPFAHDDVAQNLLYLQGYIGVIATTSMLIAALSSEKNELERRKDRFIGMASHELKTPITSLKLYTQALQRQKGYSKARLLSSLPKILKSIEKLENLVKDLLDISKINAGYLKFRKSWFDINSLASEAVKTVRPGAKQEIQIKGVVKKEIYGDRDRLGQVFINLLVNAIKYSPKSKTIRVRLKDNGRNALISIQDFGIGIPEEEQSKIFEQLYQKGNDSDGQSSGLGLGLYISKQIVDKHKGKIWVKSVEGKGSTFFFSLPLQSRIN